MLFSMHINHIHIEEQKHINLNNKKLFKIYFFLHSPTNELPFYTKIFPFRLQYNSEHSQNVVKFPKIQSTMSHSSQNKLKYNFLSNSIVRISQYKGYYFEIYEWRRRKGHPRILSFEVFITSHKESV